MAEPGALARGLLCLPRSMANAIDAMTRSARWWHALKPGSWPKVLVPTVFGQAVGAAVAGAFSVPALVFGLLWTIADVSFIVLLNDWGDQEVDAIKRRLYPNDCSPKSIPDKILPARALLLAGIAAGVAALAIAAGATQLLDRPYLLLMAATGQLVFIAYTLPPLSMNYRGGGEFLEMIGVGGVLPMLHAYAQSGIVAADWLCALLPGVLLLALASAIASGLSDENSDRIGGKRTVVTTFGNVAARRLIERLVVFAALAWAAVALVEWAPPSWVVIPSIVIVLGFHVRMRRRSAHATTDAFAAQAAYKGALHGAIWWGMGVLCALVLVAGLGMNVGGDRW